MFNAHYLTEELKMATNIMMKEKSVFFYAHSYQ